VTLLAFAPQRRAATAPGDRNRSIFPPRLAHSSKPAAGHAAVDRWVRQAETQWRRQGGGGEASPLWVYGKIDRQLICQNYTVYQTLHIPYALQ